MKKLVFRLSSLGDVILSQSVLSSFRNTDEIHWVVSSEFSGLLEGHPRIKKIWEFDRKKSNLSDWIKLCTLLHSLQFVEVIDLHKTWRTKFARILFWYLSSKNFKYTYEWKTIKKERIKRALYFTFKSITPKNLRPKHLSQLAFETLKYKNNHTYNIRLDWLTKKGETRKTEIYKYKTPISIMPASAWPGKQWPEVEFQRLCEYYIQKKQTVVILGTEKDISSRDLYKKLSEKYPEYVMNATLGYSLAETAYILSKSQFLVSNDTGIAHLAESVGCKVIGIYGPTKPDMGFGLRNNDSISINSSLWCSPCSKDGSWCFRKGESKYLCIKNVSADDVISKIRANGYAE